MGKGKESEFFASSVLRIFLTAFASHHLYICTEVTKMFKKKRNLKLVFTVNTLNPSPKEQGSPKDFMSQIHILLLTCDHQSLHFTEFCAALREHIHSVVV